MGSRCFRDTPPARTSTLGGALKPFWSRARHRRRYRAERASASAGTEPATTPPQRLTELPPRGPEERGPHTQEYGPGDAEAGNQRKPAPHGDGDSQSAEPTRSALAQAQAPDRARQQAEQSC